MMGVFMDFFLPPSLVLGFLYGIYLMQSPRTALRGNRVGALCMAVAVLITLWHLGLLTSPGIWIALILGGGGGLYLAQRVKTIHMPQVVGLLNGLGGAASALVIVACMEQLAVTTWWFAWFVSALALAVGGVTFSGSMVAALKLHGRISSRPLIFKGQPQVVKTLLNVVMALIVIVLIDQHPVELYVIAVLSLVYGYLLVARVGGADMPVIISFLNSLSGIAACISGLALGDMLAAGVGALVGVAGMILTQIMCRAMNRSLPAVLGGFKEYIGVPGVEDSGDTPEVEVLPASVPRLGVMDIPELLNQARKVVIVPGYGMALAQAQQAVKDLMDVLERVGKEVKVAVHPVAGRMPGHMHVLLAEVGVDYDKLYDMAKINHEFSETDVVIAVGACDVMNPAASTAEGTPIFGMPILKVGEAKAVIVCNLNEKPGYSGVANTLYGQPHVITVWGDASETVSGIMQAFLGGAS